MGHHMTYRKLTELVRIYEHWQQTKLKSQAGNVFNDSLLRGMCNGEVQFASVENSPGTGENDDLPIVVGVGINYGQQNKYFTDFTPLIVATAGKLDVEDKSPSPTPMRRMMDVTFDAYASNPQDWCDRKIAASPCIKLPKNPATGKYEYLLVATNFCPFLTFLTWQDSLYFEPYRAELLVQLDGKFTHLDDLEVLLREKAIWVAHGTGAEVPILFRLWQKRCGLDRWLMSCNLNPQTQNCIDNLASKPKPGRP
jgi:hypothetical protein